MKNCEIKSNKYKVSIARQSHIVKYWHLWELRGLWESNNIKPYFEILRHIVRLQCHIVRYHNYETKSHNCQIQSNNYKEIKLQICGSQIAR